MTIQSLNLITITSWLAFGCLNQLVNLPFVSLIFAVITWLVIFVLSGTSIAYVFFGRNERIVIVSDTILLFSIGILISVFFIPLFILLISTKLPLNNPFLLACIYIIFLLIPFLKSKLHISSCDSPLSYLRLLYHPLTISILIVFLIQSLSLSQFSFLPGLDTYSWLIAYENTLDHQLFDSTAGINRILFSTIVAISHQLSNISYFNLFKYWFSFFALLTVFPLWLVARSTKNKSLQYLILLSSLMSPAIILDFGTTRHQLVLLLFLYLALGILFTAQKQSLKSLLWITFLASFIGVLYHPLFLVIAIIWILAVLAANTKFLRSHPLSSIFVVLFFFTLAHSFRLIIFLNNSYLRFQPMLANFISLNWNLRYPTHFISEGVEMGWAGTIGVFKFYGFYHGPLTAFIIVCFVFFIFASQSFRKKLIQYLFTPYFFPLISFGAMLLMLGEVFPRVSSTAYLPDRALTLFGVFTPLLLILLTQSFKKIFSNKLVITFLFLLLSTSIAGSFYINSAIAHTIPDFEFVAANWIKNNLPTNRYFFTSSSKNILRYYAKSKLIRMAPETISSINKQDILAVIKAKHDIIKDDNAFIYYAVTDTRNPYTQRPYESSFTKNRPDSSFPALNSNSDFFELIYHQPSQVYIWHVKPLAYE